MKDGFGRRVNYLRISVTDRCNFRCRYCMPPEGVPLLPMAEILSYEELLRVIAVLGKYGVDRLRLTGGEPLVRRGIVDFIKQVKALGSVRDLAITTNGSLLGELAPALRRAGLNRVNISLDTSDPKRFQFITGGGCFSAVWQGVERALEVGLSPVKLNVVLTEMLTESDIHFFTEQINTKPLVIRFIEYMPIGRCGIRSGQSVAALKSTLIGTGKEALESIPGPTGNGPAKYFRWPGAVGSVGFITPMTEHFCHQCNRLRLTADGKIKPCLLTDQEFDIKGILRSNASDEMIYEQFLLALSTKKAEHSVNQVQKEENLNRSMSQVGG